MSATCRRCRRTILWATLKTTGRRIPLEPEAKPQARPGWVAYNDATGQGRVLSMADMGQVDDWCRKAPVTIHIAHFAVCAPPVRPSDGA